MRFKLLNLTSIQGPSELVTLQLILPEVLLLLFTFGFVSFISLFFSEFSIESERYQDATNVLSPIPLMYYLKGLCSKTKFPENIQLNISICPLFV